MAIHNQISRGDINDAVKRALGITKSDGGVERFSETLDVVMNPWGMPEWAWLRAEKLCGDAVFLAAGGATTLGSYALVNPTGSGLLVVVESLTLSLPAAAFATVGLDTQTAIFAFLGTVRVGTVKDTRWPGATRVPGATIRTGVPTGALGSIIWNHAAAAGVATVPDIGPVVLSPGFGLVAQSTDDNATLGAGIQWRERRAYPNELV